MFSQYRYGLFCGLAALVLCAAGGCERNEVRSYSVPKEAGTAAAGRSQQSRSAAESVEWTLPSGWEERSGTGMRFATLLVETGDDPLEIRITPLALMARDPLANVNRWRQQIGLGPIDEGELESVLRTIDIDGREAQLVSITGPAAGDHAAQQILAAILVGDERAWFFMMLDDAERVSRHEGAFETFMRSVRVRLAGLPAGHPPVGTAAAGDAGTSDVTGGGEPAVGEEIAWDTPPGWQAQPSSSQFRVAGFTVARGGRNAEIAVTRFPGDVGGLLANVNRWRRQVGLEPIDDLSAEDIGSIPIDGQSGGLIDLIGPGDAVEDAPRAIVAVVARPDMTWFFKIAGPNGFLAEEKDTFIGFVQSVRFTGDGSE